jgi:hypothetical protein
MSTRRNVDNHRGSRMDLVRDLLDAQLMDRNDCRIGRVDGVLLEIRDDRPPRVVAMEVGPITLVRRISPTLARWLRRVAVRWMPVSIRSVRLPLTLFRDVGVDIELDVDAHADRRLLRVEKWLTRHVVCRLPGAGKKSDEGSK